MPKLPYLNLGCGTTFHEDWTNLDFVSTGEGVHAHNLLQGIPFGSNTFQVVYHSHVLEHFSKKDADFFISECNRVLKKGGVLRVAIPDLERIARNYIKYLEESLQNVNGADEKYNWTMLEMYDQAVRSQMGGDMIEYIKDSSRNNDSFLLERNGNEAKSLIENIRNPKPPAKNVVVKKNPLFKRIKNKLISLFLKDEAEALRIGRFRLGGEIHQWMYDRYSLAKLLSKHGFVDIKVVQANESAITDWVRFGLDTKDGQVRKPDSLFMEAIKA